MAMTGQDVSFGSNTTIDPSAQPNRPTVHPSRSAQVPGKPDTPAKPKERSAKKKAYLAKKAKRYKVLAKAKRDAAPKNKVFTADSTAVTSTVTVSDNAEAGPSRIPAQFSASTQTPQINGDSKKRKDREESEVLAGGVGDDEGERERRRREKKEKRANRDPEERKRRKEEKALLRAKASAKEEKGKARAVVAPEADLAVGSIQNGGMEVDGDIGMPEVEVAEEEEEHEADEEDDEDEDEDEGAVERDQATLGERDTSPPTLEAFPLPTPAAAPDPAILSRQGLPANLADATIINQDLRLPIEEVKVISRVGEERGINEEMVSRLKDMGVVDFFAVQAAMLPKLMSIPLVPNPLKPINDYLISAPTGSGKTLAYSIPIVHVLTERYVTRLRALIVLPTRDLVVQVRETMEALAKGTDLTIGTATGHQSFAHEQSQLIADRETKLLGGSSKVDILIATPGRLIDHLTQTPNFTLQHLRFLVIDEADRLLNQSFHNWLQQVLSHTRPPTQRVELPSDFVRQPWDLVAGEWSTAYGNVDVNDEYYRPPVSTCHKLLFSATLTRDPAAIASLDLQDPQYFIVQESEYLDTTIGESFALPATLTERYLALPPQLKPLNLIHLLHSEEYRVRGGLVFTKSVESVSRLVSLLMAFEEEYGEKSDAVVVKGYTSDMKPAERQRILSAFVKGDVDLLICSDVIARGMDLPVVEHVISYDTPVDMRKYVHRVGRTARAGRAGTAWTLVEKQEALHFKGMMKIAGREKKVKKIKVKEDELQPYREAYERAVEKVRQIYTRHE